MPNSFKSFPPLAAQANAPYFFCEKSKQKRYRHFTARYAGALRCSASPGAKELAALRHLWLFFRRIFRFSAVHRLNNVDCKVKHYGEFQRSQLSHWLLTLLSLGGAEERRLGRMKWSQLFERSEFCDHPPKLSTAGYPAKRDTAAGGRFFAYFLIAKSKAHQPAKLAAQRLSFISDRSTRSCQITH